MVMVMEEALKGTKWKEGVGFGFRIPSTGNGGNITLELLSRLGWVAGWRFSGGGEKGNGKAQNHRGIVVTGGCILDFIQFLSFMMGWLDGCMGM